MSERVDTFCARSILVIVLFILAWSVLAYGGMDPFAFLVIQGATILALGFWVVRLWVQRPFRLLWTPMCWAVAAFLLYALVRCQLVTVEYAGRQELIRVVIYAVLFLLVLNNLNRKNSANFASFTLIGIGFVAAMLALFQFATHYPMIWGFKRLSEYMGRGSGPFVNPDHLAGFLGMIIPLALAYTIMSRASATVKVLLAYSAVTMLAGVMVTLSRGGILASLVGLVLFCSVLLVQRDFWKSALVMLCVLIALGGLAFTQLESVQKRFDEAFKADRVEDDRRLYWAAAWELAHESPLYGIGPGHFDFEFPKLRPWKVQGRPQFVHNDYLNTLCEWGVLGLGIAAAAGALLFWGVFQTWRAVRRPENDLGSRFSDRTAFIFGASVGLVVLMLHCFVEFNMHITGVAMTAVALMALLAAQMRFATERYWLNPGQFGKILLTATGAAAVVFLSVQGLHKGEQIYWLGRAQAESGHPDHVISYATKASEAEPADWRAKNRFGDYLWSLSLLDDSDYKERAQQAMTWYAKSMLLNPFDSYAPLGCGMCLDRINADPEQATRYFLIAIHNDPHNTYLALETARHCIELGELAAARNWIQNGAFMWDAPDTTDLALQEIQKLDRLMADPIYVASAEMIKTNRSQTLQREIAPLLAGPK